MLWLVFEKHLQRFSIFVNNRCNRLCAIYAPSDFLHLRSRFPDVQCQAFSVSIFFKLSNLANSCHGFPPAFFESLGQKKHGKWFVLIYWKGQGWGIFHKIWQFLLSLLWKFDFLLLHCYKIWFLLALNFWKNFEKSQGNDWFDLLKGPRLV